MAETAAVSTSLKKAKKSAKVKSAKVISATHPPTATMVNNAIKNLKERGGSSSQAIKKYISSTYKVDAEKIAPFIKKYLKSAADKGLLIRTKGKGASGSFKLPSTASDGSGKAVLTKPKSVKPKKAKVLAAKKSKSPTKPKAKKQKSAKKTKKVKKATKAPAAKKLKSPKPKKVSKAKKPALKK